MKKILVIEDNMDVRENIKEILSLSGYEVDTAENGKAGLVQLNKNRPDLIICDVMMPELDGYGVLHIVSSNPSFASIPFIFLTAKAEKIDVRKGMSLGANDYITKPFDDLDLLQTIDVQLHKHSNNVSNPISKLKTIEVISTEYYNHKIEEISHLYEIRNFKKRDVIFEEGQKCRYVYFAIKGKIKVFRLNEFGKELIIKVVNSGESFGFLDVINGKPYSKSAQAIEDCTIGLIPIKIYLDLFQDAEFALSMSKHLAVYATTLEIENIHHAYSSVRRKVANALLQFYNKNEANPVFNIMREDLAALAGAAKETVIRTLSDFKSEGLIEIEESAIIIKNIKALMSMPQ